MHWLALLSAIAFVSCATVPAARSETPAIVPAPQDGSDDDRWRREAERARADAASARLELLQLRLKLARQAGKDDDERRLLAEAFQSPYDSVKLQAIRETAGLAPDRQILFLKDLTSCWQEGSLAVRAAAVSVLGTLPDGESALLTAARDPAAQVRRAAAAGLRSGSEASLNALLRLIEDTSSEVRLAAIESAALTRTERAFAAILKTATRDPEVPVVEKAIDVLGRLASPTATLPLVQVLTTTANDSIRWSAINALGKIGAPEAAPHIRPYLRGEYAANLREIAAQALGKLRDREGLTTLAEALGRDPHPRVREALARSLGQIGGFAELRDALLGVVEADEDSAVRRAAWESALQAAGQNFDHLYVLSEKMLALSRTVEVEEVCARLHALRPDPAAAERWMALEERIVAAAMAARDYRAALGHLKPVCAARPDRVDFLHRLVQCHRELGEFEPALKALATALAQVASHSPAWWDLKLAEVVTYQAAGSLDRVVEETAVALNGNRAPEPIARSMTEYRQRATDGLIQALSSGDPAVRKRAQEITRPLGKKILAALAEAIRNSALRDRTAILETGNAIAGTSYADLSKADEISQAWKAWAQR